MRMIANAQGFTLIEVLVSLLLSSIAIICLFTLQVKDRQMLTEDELQNEAQIQVLNLRELILSGEGFSPQKILELTQVNPEFKPEILNSLAHQMVIRNTWKDEALGSDPHTFQISIER